MTNSAMMALIAMLATIVSSAGFSAGDENKHDTTARLDELLRAWEKANQDVHAIHYVMEWTTPDRMTKEKETRRLEVFIKRPSLARVDVKEENGKPRLIFALHDKTLEMYNLQNEQKGVWEIPPGFPEDYLNKDWLTRSLARTFLWNRQLFALEIPIDHIRERFDIRLKSEDQYWAYLELVPKTKEDLAEFQKMEVVLNQKTHFVRQYRLLEVSRWTILDFQKVEVNPIIAITWESISKDLPKGFQQINFPALTSNETPGKAADSKPRQP